jgi:hypothetical protein
LLITGTFGNVVLDGFGGTVSATGNVTGGNLITAAAVSAVSGNVTGNLISGNLYVNNSNATIGYTVGNATYDIGGGPTASGNIKVVSIGANGFFGSTTTVTIGPATNGSAAGTATFNTATTVAIANTSGSALSVAGNVTGGNLITSAALSAASVSASANITGGNLITSAAVSAASVSATANVQAGNLRTAGLISATGNVTGGNINTAAAVSATGNIIGGNLITGGPLSAGSVSASGNITGANLITAGTANALSFTGNTVSVAGNVTGGNINTTNTYTSNITAFAGGTISGFSNVIVLGKVQTYYLDVTVGPANIAGNLTVADTVFANLAVKAAATQAIPAGGSAGIGYNFSTTANFGIFFGSGAPTLSAAKGSLYLRSDGTTTNDRMYVNTNGSTTWTAVITAA